jgi:hypothetical protein
METMRVLLLGTAAIALSGCSWLGGSSYYGAPAGDGHGYYAGEAANTGEGCCETLSKWNVEGAIGPEYFVGGKFLTPGDTNNIPGAVPAALSMKDAYDPGMRYELGGSYALNPNRKLTLMGSYAKAKGEQVNLGTVGNNAVTGTISDYERYGIEAGLRQYGSITAAPLVKSLRPYVEGRLGASKAKAIDLENAQLGGAVLNGGTVGLYESSWVGTAAGLVGVETPIFKRATLGLETGIRYTGVMKTDTTFLGAGQALGGINNGTSNWSVPVTLRGRYRF